MPRHAAACCIFLALLLPAASVAGETVGGARAFSFVALGDMPYRRPDDVPHLERLIARINQLKPAFSIHVGDVQSSSTACTDADLELIHGLFRTFAQPLVYTPGDNEWTDCHAERAGRHDPRERLAAVRRIFFSDTSKSLGAAPMAVESQPAVLPGYAAYVENVRFWQNDVLFLTLHVVGSNNGFEVREPAAAAEFFARNLANIAWLEDGFRLARERGARAVVLAMQANLHTTRQVYPAIPTASGFLDTIRAIERGARSFLKPILVVQGDEHAFEVDGFKGPDYKRVPNVLRLQVMGGGGNVHAVRVTVDPDSPGVFGFIPLIVPENGAF